MSWTCDACGQEIASAESGWLEWLTRGVTPDEYEVRGMRLVHDFPSSPLGEGRCQYDERAEFANGGWTVSDVGLPYLVGSDGLMYLLDMLDREVAPSAEIAEFIKRIHVPMYEQARRYIDEAMSERVIDADSSDGFLSQTQLRAVVDWLQSRDA